MRGKIIQFINYQHDFMMCLTDEGELWCFNLPNQTWCQVPLPSIR